MVMNLEKVRIKAVYFYLRIHLRLLNLLMKTVSQLIGQGMPLMRLRPM